jgi:23S rRNA pseudouridine2605 synthase
MVIKLIRIRMGPLALGNLEPGEFRFLSDYEANALRELVEQRVASVERGEEAMPGPKRLVRRAGWARPVKAKKYVGKKARRV